MQAPVQQLVPERAQPDIFEHVPALFVSVSDLDRVRAFHGRHDLLPGLHVGAVLEPLLSQAADDPELSTIRLPAENGALLILRRGSERSSKLDDPVIERTQFFAELLFDRYN